MAVFIINPFVVWIRACFHKTYIIKESSPPFFASIITVVHNAEELIEEKINNCFLLQYPSNQYEVIIFSDGSTDATVERIQKTENDKLICIHSDQHQGKNLSLNQAVQKARGELLVFTDADAMLDENALKFLTEHFLDPRVGGVCGQRVIARGKQVLKTPQKAYIRLDSHIKMMESRLGQLTSNDGKIYAIRKSLFQELHPAVTDDLFTCLSVISQQFNFIYDSNVLAYIQVPSQTSAHEIVRRRRIVARSLRGIYLKKTLLNPFRSGHYAFHLLCNKVFRRLIPFFMIGLFFSSVFLSKHSFIFRVFLLLQIGGLSLGFLYPYISKYRILKKISSLIYYFCIGNLGSMLGVLDFMVGKEVTKWQPQKKD